jgi:hypothetical protein
MSAWGVWRSVRALLLAGWALAQLALSPPLLRADDLILYEDFRDPAVSPGRWTVVTTGSGPTLSVANQQLVISLPAFSSNDPTTATFGVGLVSTCQLRGDFDVQVQYTLLRWPATNGVRLGLGVGTGRLFVDLTPAIERVSASVNFPDSPGEYYLTHFEDGVLGHTRTSDLSGTLRLVRTDASITGLVRAGGGWTVVHAGPVTTADVRVVLAAWSHDNLFADQDVSAAFDNVLVSAGQLLCPDRTPPTTVARVTPPPTATGWHRSDVTVTLSASDTPDGTGVRSLTYRASGAQPLPSTVVFGTTAQVVIAAEGLTTLRFFAIDLAGNVEPERAVTVRLDKTPPVLNPTVSPDPVELNGTATATPGATDALSGVATQGCTPPDTSVVGTKTVVCRASDQAGNEASGNATYRVTYRICPLYDQNRAVERGSTVPIKVQLCDTNGTNASTSTVVVRAVGLVLVSTNVPQSLNDAGHANPDSTFRFDPTLAGGGYIYNVSTKELGTGTYRLRFTVSGDPVEHAVEFQVR